ncbi:MAG TPA: hypothetical protein VLA04_05400 [Verrucomicrobiae bacterium]|nr:hypothetical protein [Verrucomicrobiae bacterium]
MDETLKEKLQDYLEGLSSIHLADHVALGAVVFPGHFRPEVNSNVREAGIPVEELNHFDHSFSRPVVESALRQGEAIALNCSSEPQASFLSFLRSNLDTVTAQFNGTVLLLLSDEQYAHLPLQEELTSVCSLA